MADKCVTEPKSTINPALAQLPEKMRTALALHESGQLAQAQALYIEILAHQPRHCDALNLLGAIALQTGDLRRAAEVFDKATEIDPGNAVAWCNRALAFAELNQLEAALTSYDRAISINAEFAEAYFKRGQVLYKLKRWDAALASYDRAIQIDAGYAEACLSCGHVLRELKQWEAALTRYEQAIALVPDYEEACFHSGNVFAQLQRWNEALASFEQAIALKPDYAEAYFNRGNVLVQLRRFDAAVDSYDQAIALKPDHAEAYSNRGYMLAKTQRLDAALASYDQAIALKPDYAEAYSNRGNLLAQLRRFDAALDNYDQAIALKPDYAEAHSNRGIVLKETDQLDAALASYEQAIALKADYADAYTNRGNVLARLQRFDAALSSYSQAIALKVDCAEAYTARAMVLLSRGDLDNGWIDYEWRRKVKDGLLEYGFVQPMWLGKESIAGKAILLYGEQGLGDTLQFCRYVKSVADLGASVILEVPKPLRRLLTRLEGVSQTVTRGESLPKFDYQCSLLSLPLAFKTSLATVPSSAKYLTVDATKIAQWQARLGEKTTARIGLVWSGNPMHKNDRNRSILLANLIRYLPAGLQYVSLQKDMREGDRQTLQSNPGILQFSDELNDFSDTAALCECMDVVISVDTSVAHLSGALGKNTWILLPSVSDWRWLLDRDDSPWYPTARLYRQQSTGDWSDVLERIKARLIQICGL